MLYQERWKIQGLVQGVGYRAFAARTGEALGLRGWVQNNPDGSVELLAQGSKGDLERFWTECEKGSAKAQVHKITRISDTKQIAVADLMQGFSVKAP